MQSMWKRVLLLKKGLQLCLALNVLCVVTGVVVGVDHWVNRQNLVQDSTITIERLNGLEELRSISDSLINQNPLVKSSSSYEADLFKRWEKWRLLNENLKKFGLKGYSQKKSSLDFPNGFSNEELQRLQFDLHAQQMASLSELKSLLDRISSYHWQLALVAALTLLFGIILPAIIFTVLLRLLNAARHELLKQIKDWVDGWVTQSRRDEPFKDPEFWVYMSLLSVELVTNYSKHPIAQAGGEISRLVRRELDKSKGNHEKNCDQAS